MSTVLQDIAFRVGEDVEIPASIFEADCVTPADITGWSVAFALHRDPGDTIVLVAKTTGAGITLTTPLAGVLTVTLAAADTADLHPGLYHYEIGRTGTGVAAVLTTGVCELRAR